MKTKTQYLCLMLLAACGGTTTTTITETFTEVPNTINGIPITEANPDDIPGDEEADREAEEAALSEELGLDYPEWDRVVGATLDAQLDQAAPTAVSSIPTSGTATFEGRLTFVGTAPDDDFLVGTALVDITADFTSGAEGATATVGKFVALDDDRELFAYDGSATLTNGRVGQGAANTIGFDSTGDLTGNGHSVSFSGPIDGTFVGADLVGLAELAGSEDGVSVIIDGTADPSGFLQLEALKTD